MSTLTYTIFHKPLLLAPKLPKKCSILSSVFRKLCITDSVKIKFSCALSLKGKFTKRDIVQTNPTSALIHSLITSFIIKKNQNKTGSIMWCFIWKAPETHRISSSLSSVSHAAWRRAGTQWTTVEPMRGALKCEKSEVTKILVFKKYLVWMRLNHQ